MFDENTDDVQHCGASDPAQLQRDRDTNNTGNDISSVILNKLKGSKTSIPRKPCRYTSLAVGYSFYEDTTARQVHRIFYHIKTTGGA
jgi:hypothetical protein